MFTLQFMSNCLPTPSPSYPLVTCSMFLLSPHQNLHSIQWATVPLSKLCLLLAYTIPCCSQLDIALLVVLPKLICVSSSSIYKLSQCWIFLLLCSETHALDVHMQTYPSFWFRVHFQACDSLIFISVLALAPTSWLIWLPLERSPEYPSWFSYINRSK